MSKPKDGPAFPDFIQGLAKGEMDLRQMDGLLALYRSLAPLVLRPLPLTKPLKLPSGDAARVRLAEGFTLLDPGALRPDAKALQRRLGEVLAVLGRHSAEKKDAVDRAAGVFSAPRDAERFARSALEEGEEGLREALAGSGVDPEVGSFAVFNALKGAFLEAASGAPADLEAPEKGACPVCGGAAAAADFSGEGGKRSLSCHRCQARWGFRRLRCPFCGNQDHDTLGYFTLEGEAAPGGVRVYTCRSCQGFIKTWDLREREGATPLLEDLFTPRLDLAAEGGGFLRKSPNVFGIRVKG